MISELISHHIMINERYKKCTSLKFWQKIFKVLKVLILLISFSSISIISLNYNILSMTQNSGRTPWGQGDTPSIQPIIRIMTVLHLLCFTFPYFHSSRDQICFSNNNSPFCTRIRHKNFPNNTSFKSICNITCKCNM